MAEELFTEEEKEKFKQEALKELEAEQKKRAKEDYKAAVKSLAKKKELIKDAETGEGEGLEPVYIDLPSVAECIRLDGRAFYHSRTYNVTPEVKSTLLDIMGRGEEHEQSLMDKEEKKNAYRKRSSLSANIHSNLVKKS